MFYYIDFNDFWEIYSLSFFPYKRLRKQIWPCHKIGQCQPKVIIWTELVILEHPIMHTKFRVNGLLVTEKKFLKVLSYMAMAVSLVMWSGPFEQTFVLPSHWGSTWNLALVGPAVPKKIFENDGRRRRRRWRTTDRRRTDDGDWLLV